MVLCAVRKSESMLNYRKSCKQLQILPFMKRTAVIPKVVADREINNTVDRDRTVTN